MATSYFSRTPSSTGNRKTFTFSTWIKKSDTTSRYQLLFMGNNYTNSNLNSGVYFDANNKLNISTTNNGTNVIILTTTQLFRDVSAWYNIVVAIDTTQATSSNRIKLYVNGLQVTTFDTATYPTQNLDTAYNQASIPQVIGFRDSEVANYYFDGLIANTILVDGQQLDASSFGETDATTGIWKFKRYSGSYGTNGFLLKFENSASLGTDSSGNGNNFTANGTPTQTQDTPSNVFATFNAVDKSGGTATTFSNGNLNVKHANGSNGAVTAQRSTLAISKGKWYWEAKCIAIGGDVRLGIISMSSTDYVTTANPYTLNECYNYKQSAVKGSSGNIDVAYGATYTAGDIISVLYDADNGSLTFYKNGTTQGVAFSGLNTSFTWGAFSTEYSSGEYAYNFGNGVFGTTAITSPYSDTAGLGKFQYAVPAGYYSLCTKNINSQG